MTGPDDTSPDLGEHEITLAAGEVIEAAETIAVLSAVITGHAVACPLCQDAPGKRPGVAGVRLLPGGAGRDGDRAPIGAEPFPRGSVSPLSGAFPSAQAPGRERLSIRSRPGTTRHPGRRSRPAPRRGFPRRAETPWPVSWPALTRAIRNAGPAAGGRS